MLIGILQTGSPPDALIEKSGTYPDMFRSLLADHGLEFREYSVVDMDFPNAIDDCDGWLLTGSRHGAYEDHAFIPPLEDFIRKCFEAAIPMVGVCFGHQIIAQALGGKVEKYEGGWSVGPQAYDFNGRTVWLNAWHQDQVTEAPAAAKTCGSSGFCENAALVYDDRIFTLQAHPEFDKDYIEDLMKTRGPGLVPDARLKAAHARLDQELDREFFATTIANFFLKPRESAATQR